MVRVSVYLGGWDVETWDRTGGRVTGSLVVGKACGGGHGRGH